MATKSSEPISPLNTSLLPAKASSKPGAMVDDMEDAAGTPSYKFNMEDDFTNQRGAWLSCELLLDGFSVKDQTFTITAWINVLYKEEKQTFINKLRREFFVNRTESKHNEDYEGCIHCGEEHDFIKYVKCEHENIHCFKKKNDTIIRINDLRTTIHFPYELPIDPRRIFYEPSVLNVTHFLEPHLYYSTKREVIQLKYSITAELLEHLELFAFPFEAEFLNIKIRWEFNRFYVYHHKNEKKEAEEALFDNDYDRLEQNILKEYLLKAPINIRLRETISHEITLETPFVDFRMPRSRIAREDEKLLEKTRNLRFGLIRLRILKNPAYAIFNILFPIFCIVNCSFTIFFLDESAVASRLSLSITILLTFTVFQNAVANELPEISKLLFIDWYVIAAYLVQMMLIICSCIIGMLVNTNEIYWVKVNRYWVKDLLFDYNQDMEQFNEVSFDSEQPVDHTISRVDKGFGWTMAICWWLLSIFYASLYCDFFKQIWYSIFKSCTLCDCADLADWNVRAEQELEDWSKSTALEVEFKVPNYRVNKKAVSEESIQLSE